MQFIDIGGVTLHYQLIGGPADKPAIVFVNSLGTDFRIWRDVIVRLAGDFPIVTYDKRGHGLSDVGAAPYAMEDHVGDLEALLDHLNVKSAIICGLSVGGLIAQGFMRGAPISCARSSCATPPTRSALPRCGMPASPPSRRRA